MHIIFCGTPQFAVPTLERLLAAGFTLDLVVTNPDEPSGRSYERKAPPVKVAAEKAGLPVFQPAKLKDPTTQELLAKFHPDAIVVVAYGHIIPPWMIELPRLGSINLHSGKAPEYRGAAPGFWELYNGEREVGITIHRVATALDAGDILLQETFPLDPAPAEDPLGYLERYRREVLRPNGVRLLAQTVAQIATGRVSERPQDPARAQTYRTPDYRAIRELRRRVAARRLERAGVGVGTGLGEAS